MFSFDNKYCKFLFILYDYCMKKGLILGVGLLIILFCLNKSNVLASGFNIKSIGAINTDGQQLSHWWYTNSSPTIVGEAPSGSSVSISIDGTETSITADSNNSWTYTTGSLNEGDHNIVVGNNGATISFILTTGASNINWDAVAKTPTQTLPTVGIILPTVLMSMSGLGLIFAAKRIAK